LDAARALARDCARRLRRAGERVKADVVGVGERGFLAGDSAHAYALVDVEAARLDDSLLQTPRLAAAVLEIEIGIVDAVRHDLPEHRLQALVVQRIRRQQCGVSGGEELLGLQRRNFGYGGGCHDQSRLVS